MLTPLAEKKIIFHVLYLLACIPSAPPDTAQFQLRWYRSQCALQMFEMLAKQIDREPTMRFLLQVDVSALCVLVHLVQ